MLSKCCTHCVSRFAKPSSGYRIEKGQSSFQFPTRAVLKNVLAIGQLHSSPMLVKLRSKSSKWGFSITWTENFQMSKVGCEKEEEPEIKLPTYTGSQRKLGSSRETSTSVSSTMPKPLTVWLNKIWKALRDMGIPDYLTCLLRNLYASQEATVKTGLGTITGSKLGKECVRVVYCHLAYLTYMQCIASKMLGWIEHKL